MSGFSSAVARLAGAPACTGCRSNQRRCSSRTTSTGDPAESATRQESADSLDRVVRTQANIFSADEGADVGLDGETPVTDDYKEGDNKFTGKIQKVVIEVGPVKVGAADREEMRKAELSRKAAE